MVIANIRFQTPTLADKSPENLAPGQRMPSGGHYTSKQLFSSVTEQTKILKKQNSFLHNKTKQTSLLADTASQNNTFLLVAADLASQL